MSADGAPDPRIEKACEVMHDAYEQAAVDAGWETQARSRVPWADVPEANKATMRVAVNALMRHVADDPMPEALLDPGDMFVHSVTIVGYLDPSGDQKTCLHTRGLAPISTSVGLCMMAVDDLLASRRKS